MSESLEPVQLAMRITSLESAVEAMVNSTRQTQEDVRAMTRAMNSLQTLALQHEQTGSGLERAFGEIAKTNERLDKTIQEWTRESERRVVERDTWRAAHVAENAKTEKTLTRWSGMAIGGSLFFGTVLALVVYIYSTEKANISRDIDTIRIDERRHYEAFDQRLDHAEQVLLTLCVERANPNCKPFR